MKRTEHDFSFIPDTTAACDYQSATGSYCLGRDHRVVDEIGFRNLRADTERNLSIFETLISRTNKAGSSRRIDLILKNGSERNRCLPYAHIVSEKKLIQFIAQNSRFSSNTEKTT